MSVAVIIPSLKPNEKLLSLVSETVSLFPFKVIVVNDGSPREYDGIFERLETAGCDVLAHNTNLGKGSALKTGICFALSKYPDADGIITADADGQHLPRDILRAAELLKNGANGLILGVRDFDEKHVPFKSRYGNKITSFVFRLKTGIDLRDTQTGLRAAPMSLAEDLLNITGERFEYEMNMLFWAVSSKIPFITVPITTVYAEKRHTTHFHAVRDSAKIYLGILKYRRSRK